MSARLVLALALATVAASAFAASDSKPAGTPLPADEKSKPYGALKYRTIGPAVGGRVDRVTGVPGDPLTFYLAAAQGGIWKSENGGRDFKPIFDDQANGEHRLDRGGGIRSQRALCRHRRSEHSRQRVVRHRHLQVGRRRQELETGVEDARPDRHDRDRPAQRRCRLCRRVRFAVRREQGARRLSHDRRRQELAARAVQGRTDRRVRCRDRSEPSARAVRRPVAGEALSVGHDLGRARAAACIAPTTAAIPGSRSPSTACRSAKWARSASPLRAPTRLASMR